MEEKNMNISSGNNNKMGIGILVGLLIALVIGMGTFIVYDKFVKEDKKDNGKDDTPIVTPNNNNNGMVTIDDKDTSHEVTTFDNIVNVWSKDVTKNKAYKIQNVVLNNKKASLYVDYTFEYEKVDYLPESKTTGKTKLTIKHGDTVLYTNETVANQGKSILQYLNIIDNNYLIYGEKLCSAYDSNNNCSVHKTDSYSEISIISNSQKEDVKKYLNNNDYYVYDLSSNNNGITIKTLYNGYGSGMWSCDESTGDVQRIYNVNYSSKAFTEAKMISSISFKDFCKNKDESVF